jgi:hypothetical protein
MPAFEAADIVRSFGATRALRGASTLGIVAYGITIHTFIIGQPFRLCQFRRVLEHMDRFRDRVWFTTAAKAAQPYASLFPALAQGPQPL